MKTTVSAFWKKNKVLITGVLLALALAAQQLPELMAGKVTDWPALVLALGTAVISYIARTWRGQTTSIAGLAANSGFAMYTVNQTGHLTWIQVIIQLYIMYQVANGPDAKSVGFEQTEGMKALKREGEIIQPAIGTNPEIKKEAQAIKDAGSDIGLF